MENQEIVFAYWKDNELKGFRADTFNTISMEYPKVYTYSTTQVEIVMSSVLSGCNNAGKSFFKELSKLCSTIITPTGNEVSTDLATEHVSKTELTFREWGEFEVRVHPFSNKEEFYSLGEGDEWKRNKILSELEPALEIRKFKIVQNEN